MHQELAKLVLHVKKILIGIFVLLCPFIYSLSTELSLIHNEPWFGVAAELMEYQTDELIENLNLGLTAEINFYFKLFQVDPTSSMPEGDKLLFEVKRVSKAYKDFFDDLFIIEKDGEKFFFANREQFEKSFLSIKIDQLIQIGRINTRFYLLGKVELLPVVLNSPLHLIQILNPIVKNTPWERLDINGS